MRASLFRKGDATVARRQCAAPISRFACTIRAYPAHAAELSNPNPTDVHFFYKPPTAAFQLPIVDASSSSEGAAKPKPPQGVVPIPTRFGDINYELEICLLISAVPLPDPVLCSSDDAQYDPAVIRRSIEGVGLGLDWTARQVQGALTKQGLPWERAKAFERSAAVTEFADTDVSASSPSPCVLDAKKPTAGKDFPQLKFTLLKNGAAVQNGDTDALSFCPFRQVWEMHKVTRLNHGDVVMTGTPAGVGIAAPGDDLQLVCADLGLDVAVKVVSEEDYARM